MSEDLLELAANIEMLVDVIGIPTLIATGPDMFGDYNLTPKDETAAVAAVVSNMRDPDVVKASALLMTILWHAAPEIITALKTQAALGTMQ